MNRIRQLLVLGVGLAVLVVGISLITANSTVRDDPGSSANGKAGTLALYTWMTELGFQTSRIDDTFTLHNIDTLMLLEPTRPPTGGDVAKIDEFLKTGGTVVVADDSEYVTGKLLDKYGLSSGTPVEDGNASPAIPLNSANSIHTVPLSAASEINGDKALPLLSLNGSTVAAGRSIGKGHLYFVSSESPFSNDGLRHADSAAFVLSLVGHSRGGRIGFDEVHHGSVGAGQFLGLGMDEIFTGPLGLSVIVGLLLLAAYMVLNGRHLGRPLPRRDSALVPSAVDRLNALAQLVARTGDKGAIARDYVEELKNHVGSITGVPALSPDDEFLAALASGPISETKILMTRGRSLERSKPSEPQLVAFAGDIVALEKRWSDPVTPQEPRHP